MHTSIDCTAKKSDRLASPRSPCLDSVQNGDQWPIEDNTGQLEASLHQPVTATGDAIVSHYHNANRDQLIQRLLLKKWALLDQIERFLIEVSECYFNDMVNDNSNATTKIANMNEQVLTLIKKQHQLRIRHPSIDIMQTSKNIEQLQSLSIATLNEILHDFDNFQRDIRQLITAQQDSLVFTTFPLEETIEHLLKGYTTVSRY